MRVITGAMFHIVTAIIIYLNLELCITHVVAASDSSNIDNVTITWTNGGSEVVNSSNNATDLTHPTTVTHQSSPLPTSSSVSTSTSTTESAPSSIARIIADVESLTTTEVAAAAAAASTQPPALTELSSVPVLPASNASELGVTVSTTTTATTTMATNATEGIEQAGKDTSGCTTSKREYRIST